MNNDRDTFEELRGKIDGSDPFMTGGHQIIKPRSDSKKKVPKWSRDDVKIKAALLTSFPKLEVNPKQRARAARWLRVIHLYFRMGLTRGQVAEELGITSIAVKDMIKGIRRVVAGGRVRDPGVRRTRGRPRNRAPIQTPLGEHK